MIDDVKTLELQATRARRLVLRMLRAAGAGHMGGAMSAIDIVTAVYFHALHIDPSDPRAEDRDRFLLSAGHKAMAQYAVLAARGFFAEELVDTYGTVGSKLPGHPDMHKLPGIEANTGALGHGLAIAAGMALGQRLDGRSRRVITVLGDGELPEGSNWEGAAIAAHHGLDNLLVFVDVNHLQISGSTSDVMDMEPIAGKFEAFGWATRTIDGHDMREIVSALDEAPLTAGRPTAVVAQTVKGRGVLGLEGTLGSHYWKPTAAELDEVDRDLARLEVVLRQEVTAA